YGQVREQGDRFTGIDLERRAVALDPRGAKEGKRQTGQLRLLPVHCTRNVSTLRAHGASIVRNAAAGKAARRSVAHRLELEVGGDALQVLAPVTWQDPR